jgi:hypothetical protein
MPLTLDKIQSRKWLSKTTCTTADLPAAKKREVPAEWTDIVGDWILNGDDVYVYQNSIQRAGINAPNTATSVAAVNSANQQVVMLTDTTGVTFYLDGSGLLKAIPFTLANSGAPTFGSAVSVNAADTEIDYRAMRVTSTTYAVAYIDDGGSDYLCARMGSVSANAITQGDEKELTAASVKVTSCGMGIAMPRDGIIAVAYVLAGDTYGYVVAVPFTTITFGTAGTAVKHSGTTAVTYQDMCSDRIGYVCCAYNGASNYVEANIGTVSAACVVAFGGSAEAMNAATSTSIRIKSPSTAKVVMSWIDSGDVHMIAGTTATTVITQGTETVVLAGTCLTPTFSMWSDSEGIIVYEEQGTTTYGYAVHFTIAWATVAITCDTVHDVFSEVATTYPSVSTTTKGTAVCVYNAAGAAVKATYLNYNDRIIDVRSSNASADYDLRIFPTYRKEITY